MLKRHTILKSGCSERLRRGRVFVYADRCSSFLLWRRIYLITGKTSRRATFTISTQYMHILSASPCHFLPPNRFFDSPGGSIEVITASPISPSLSNPFLFHTSPCLQIKILFFRNNYHYCRHSLRILW